MPASHDIAAVIHVHSLYSDGSGSVEEIAAAGNKAGVDVVMLTDHDTLGALRDGKEGWYDDTLLIVGHEISPRRGGHYLAFGLNERVTHRGKSHRQIVDQVAGNGGWGLIAHPFSRGSHLFKRGGKGMPWLDLELDSYTGIELWSFVTDTFEKLRNYGDVVRFLASPNGYVDRPPAANLTGWDQLCRRRRVVAFGGLDAHQVGLRVRGRLWLRLMPYHKTFGTLRTRVLLDEPLTKHNHERDREAVFSAIRSGHCYLAMDSLADANGFTFSATDGAGRHFQMGDETGFGDTEQPGWQLKLSTPAPAATLRLIHNGKPICTASDSVQLEHRATEPGVYRAEATLRHAGRERSWIFSNPIYLR